MQCYTKAINYERMNSGNQNQTNMMTLVANPIVEKCLTKMANEVTLQVRNKLIEGGVDPLGSSPEEFAAYVRSETARWTKVIKVSKVKVD